MLYLTDEEFNFIVKLSTVTSPIWNISNTCNLSLKSWLTS